jgi:CHAT domain-containing protein
MKGKQGLNRSVLRILAVPLFLMPLMLEIQPSAAQFSIKGKGPTRYPQNPTRQPPSDSPRYPHQPRQPGFLFPGLFNPSLETPRQRKSKPDLEQSPEKPEDQLQDPATVIEGFERRQNQEFTTYFGWQQAVPVTTARQLSAVLGHLAQQTGQRPAAIYVIPFQDRLETILVLPHPQGLQASQPRGVRPSVQVADRLNPGRMLKETIIANGDTLVIRKVNTKVDAEELRQVAETFRRQVSDPRQTQTTNYQSAGKQLYQWLIAPLEEDLQANQIKTLVFALDDGLRSLPIAALTDGQQFLIEKYSVATVPSFSLTDTCVAAPLGQTQMLGMGISEGTAGLSPLPAVSVEVPTLAQQIWRGEAILNQQSTLSNLNSLLGQQRFQILHLATHAEFNQGKAENSFIQFWDARLRLGDLRNTSLQGRWVPTLDLLVLSACQTALGNNQAELGFAGVAVQSGIETALGSLWRVNDVGSLGLMTSFYGQLKTAPTRAEALRQAQLAMLKGRVQIQNQVLQVPGQAQVSLPADLQTGGNMNLAHPYYWSAFQMVGNWN